MVSKPEYRWDFIGLSTQSKPTPETSENVTDGSTFYEADTSKLYIFYQTQWYEKTATGGGGYTLPIASANTLGGVKIGEGLTINAETGVLSSSGGGGADIPTLTPADYDYPTTGTKTAINLATMEPGYYKVGSEDVVIHGNYDHTIPAYGWLLIGGPKNNSGRTFTFTSSTGLQTGKASATVTKSFVITIGDLATSAGNSASTAMTQKAITEMVFKDPSTRRVVSIGDSSNAEYFGTALGVDAKALGRASVALAGSSTSEKGVFAVGLASGGSVLGTTDGYNGTAYRLITGVHDPQTEHDAATKGYVDSLISALEARVAALE